MSNIITEQTRLYFCPGVTLTPTEVETLLERILDERGSYWVPVWYELVDGSHIDFQYGSGKAAGLHNLDEDELAQFEEIWVRVADEGSDHDVIYAWSPARGDEYHDGYPRKRPCRYAFDQIDVVLRERQCRTWMPSGLPWDSNPEGFRARCSGSYLTLNERIDMDLGPRGRLGMGKESSAGFSSPNTSLGDLEMPQFSEALAEVAQFLAVEQPGLLRVELRYAGRVVHRAERGAEPHEGKDLVWQHRSGDHWDNCVDAEFVRARKV